ncbi:DNA-directed DNA polymerase [Linderina pennispora]|nr:DNA-directed DNA polymerase [Linderina pennispora]
MSTTLNFYWDLASLDESKRVAAAAQLITSLCEFQAAMPASTEVAATEEDLGRICASDVVYAIKRLIKGLASPRDGARQGFSLALTELLARVPCISSKVVLDLLWKHCAATSSMKGQEQRDMRFGRVFGIMALVQSGALARPASTTAADIKRIVVELTQIGAKKTYCREICYVTMASLVPVLAAHEDRDSLIAQLVGIALNKGMVETPDELLLALRLRRAFPEFDWHTAFPKWHGAHLLCRENMGKLASILSESSSDNPALFSSWHPQLHTVWDEILDLYFGQARGAERTHVAGFAQLWDAVVDGRLFAPGGSQFKRYWGFLLLDRVLPHMSQAMIPTLMTPNLVRCMSENVSVKKNTPLAKVGARTAEKLVKAAEADSKVGFAMLTHLLSHKNSTGSNSGSTLSAMVTNRIVAKLDASAITDYVTYLQKLYISPEAPGKDGEEAEELNTRTAEKQRQWAIMQMVRVVRIAKADNTDEVVRNVLNFLAVHASLEVFDASKTIPECPEAPVPRISANNRAQCATDLLQFVGDLNRQTGEESGDSRRLGVGCARDGTVWATAALTRIVAAAKQYVTRPFIANFDEVLPEVEATLKDLKAISAKTAQQAKSNMDNALRFRALELLIANICLLAVLTNSANDASEYMDALGELRECYEKLVPALEGTKKKTLPKRKTRAAAKAEEEGEPMPVEVLTDILISLMTKESAAVRKLCVQVFAPFTGMLTEDALESILGVIRAREGMGGEDGGNIETEMEIADDLAMGAGEEDEEPEEDEDEDAIAPEQIEAVDEELRRKIEEALGDGVVRDDAASGSEGEEFDDEQMTVFDDKLAEIFAIKKQEKADARNLKISFANFKLRVLDLADVFMARQPQHAFVMTLLLELVRQAKSITRDSRNRPIYERIMAMLDRRGAGEFPQEFPMETAASVLEIAHKWAMRAGDLAQLRTLGALSAFVSRAVIDTHGKPGEKLVSECYAAAQRDFFGRKASQLQTPFFQPLAAKLHAAQLAVPWKLAAAAVAEFGKPGAAINTFRQAHVFELAALTAQSAQRLAEEAGQKTAVPLATELVGAMHSALAAVLASVAMPTEDAKTVEAGRFAEIVKHSVGTLRHVAKCEAFRKPARTAFETAQWTALIDSVRDSAAAQKYKTAAEKLRTEKWLPK